MGRKELRTPIRWLGGKGRRGILKRILSLFPPHKIYVEPFGGGASLLLAKEPSPVEVYNDIDSGLVNFFRILRDKEKFQEFHRKACLTPYSREEYYFCRDTWEECKDDVERAYRWYVVARMSFGGRFGSGWGFVVSYSLRGISERTSNWLSALDMLPEIHQRIMRVQIEHNDYKKILETYDTSETLFYCDPPYVLETRRAGEYRHEMTVEDHEELVDILLSLKGMVILSGYRHKVYEPLEEAGWERVDLKVACSVVGRTRQSGLQGKGNVISKQSRVESVWISPNVRKKKNQYSLFQN